MHRFLTLGALALLPACATITQGSTDTVTIDTRPPGASCEIKQDGQVIAFINPTPGSMVVPKSKNDIAVLCQRDGYESAAGAMASEFAGMTFGNILFGGVIGVAVDAASGAMNQYPPLITLTLQPKEFRDLDEKDDFFDNQRDEFIRQYDATVARIKDRCEDRIECDRQIAAAEKAKETKLIEIEQHRLAARVAA